MEKEEKKSIISRIRKRDGKIVLFDQDRITNAIFKAAQAVGGQDKELSKRLSDQIVRVLEERFGTDIIPTVEQIQDIVEKVLIENGHAKTAKAYILYREQRRKIREMTVLLNSIEVIDDYVNQLDWRVKENSNMGYSLQGLNNHVATTIVSKYWLNKLYPDYIREAHENARMHIHDLGTLGVYCIGWDLKDLLLTGFKGVPGKTESKPPKHFRTALGQIVNFFYTLQGESAGAVAFSNFDTLLAPFIHYDRLNHKGIKQAMQEFIFNMNVPTRVGFQCLSEDTEILTVEGWKRYDKLKKGVIIKTFNIKKGLIEDKKVKSVFKKEYKGVMYNLKDDTQDQLISPMHRIIKKETKNKYSLIPIEEVLKLKTFIAPQIKNKRLKIKDKKVNVQKIKKVDYSGIIWCPNTENETVIAKRNGKVFITGNTPFTNLTLDLKVPNFMKNENVIIGGKLMAKRYKDFQEEMDWVNEIFAEIMMEGDSKNRPFTFPIPTYNITKEFDWDNKSHDKLWEMTARFGIPYFSNFIHSDMKPEDARSMCCRLRISTRELKKRGGGLFGANPLTGSIGVATINMPQLGYLSKNETEFFEKLEEVMKIAKDSLEIKRKVLEKFTEMGLYPYSKFYLRRIKEGYDQHWKNHFSTIGINGMNEALLNLLNTNIASKEGIKFTIKVLDFMREKISKYQEETGNLYNLEATPAEGCGTRLAKIDKKLYPEIIVANEKAWQERKAAPFYTNSTQLPVDYTDDIFEALRLQEEIQTKYTGGTTIHGFLGERISSIETTKLLIRKIAENFKIPYYTLTPTFSVCPIHGYLPGEHEYCPKCDEEIGHKRGEQEEK